MNSTVVPTPVRRVASEQVVLPPALATPDTRGRILEASLGLFAERGYAGTSIRDIAGEVGIQSATLYGHFPSKEHILAELAEAGHEAHRRVLADAVEASGTEPADQLAALVRAHVLFHAEFAMLAIVANAELQALSPELVAGSITARSESERLFTAPIARGIKLGQFRHAGCLAGGFRDRRHGAARGELVRAAQHDVRRKGRRHLRRVRAAHPRGCPDSLTALALRERTSLD